MGMGRWVAVLLAVLAQVRPAAAINHLIAIGEVLASWQGDDTVQFVELRMLAAGQGGLSTGGGLRGSVDLVVDDATASVSGLRVFTITSDVGRAEAGASVLVGT